jgi:ectoine hydroxylase-related dioxygenase (phytanoyl-CoA dioxygenase family)
MCRQAEATERAIAGVAEAGYGVLPAVVTAQQVNEALILVRQLAEAQRGREPASIPRLDSGQETVYNLQNKSAALLKLLLRCAPARAVLMHFLNDRWHRAIPQTEPNYILRSYSARNNLVAAPMHIDSFIPYTGVHALSMQVAIVLQPQHTENGCTLVVPGSQQSGEYVTQARRADCIPVETEAGDVVVWDSRIWHGTGENRSGESRWSLIATFVRWWVKQGYRITDNLPQSIYAQLSNSEKAVLGFCAMPSNDEHEGVDFKTSYDDLKPHVDDYR